MEIREIFAKIDGVDRVHPYGSNGKVVVHVVKKDALDRKKAEELLKGHEKFKLRKFKKA